MIKNLHFGTIVLLLLFSGAGCAGYRLGPQTNTPYSTVAIPIFRNQTFKPQLEAQITNAVITELQGEGKLQVESVSRADAILYGIIVKYERNAVRALQEETRTAREYRITITLEVELRNRVTDEVLIQPTQISASIDTFIGSDLQSAETLALPLVAKEVAKKVVTLIADRW